MESSQSPMAPELSSGWVHRLRKKILLLSLAVFTFLLLGSAVALLVLITRRVETENQVRAEELAAVVLTSMSHLMMNRDPDGLQETLEKLPTSHDLPLRAFLLNPDGKVVYSSERADRGHLLARLSEPSCAACHADPGRPRERTTLVMATAGGYQFQRTVILVPNEPRCQSCHPSTARLLGKLVVDRSTRGGRELVRDIEVVVAGAGLVCLLLGLPLLGRGLGRYVSAIVRQSSELGLLYLLTDRLSRTIEPQALNVIIAGIIEDVFEGEEVVIMLPRSGDEVRCYSRARGGGELRRVKLSPGDPLSLLAGRWRAGALGVGELSADGQDLVIPVSKDGRRLALIVSRQPRQRGTPWRQRIAMPVAHHIAVALENARLYCLAITDELTGLYARRHFGYSVEKLLNAEGKGGPIFSLAMIDIDDFKRINDTHGHQAGDTVLREVARALQQSVRDNDMVFRYGGEEFVALLAGCDARDGRIAAERMRRNVEQTICRHESLELGVTISVGLTDSLGMLSMEEMVKCADAALYQAKHSGKNRVALCGETGVGQPAGPLAEPRLVSLAG